MKRISYKKILLVIILFICVFSIATSSYASLPDIKPNTSAPGVSQVKSVAEMVLGIAQILGLAVAVVMMVVLAIKYMSAAPGEKANVKQSLIIFVIGALLLFAGATVLKVINHFATEVNSKIGVSIVRQI